jgi:hypothetical protein
MAMENPLLDHVPSYKPPVRRCPIAMFDYSNNWVSLLVSRTWILNYQNWGSTNKSEDVMRIRSTLDVGLKHLFMEISPSFGSQIPQKDQKAFATFKFGNHPLLGANNCESHLDLSQTWNLMGCASKTANQTWETLFSEGQCQSILSIPIMFGQIHMRQNHAKLINQTFRRVMSFKRCNKLYGIPSMIWCTTGGTDTSNWWIDVMSLSHKLYGKCGTLAWQLDNQEYMVDGSHRFIDVSSMGYQPSW